MKPKVFLIGLSFLFFLISAFFLFSSPVKALISCCPLESGDCSDIIYCLSNIASCCYPNCPYEDWTATDLSVCQANIGEPEPDVCAGGGGVSTSPCGSLGPWSYCYVSGCEIKGSEREAGQCDYQYQYSFTSCSAWDTCIDSAPYLRAGQCGWGSACDDSGCTYSGIYKTCCEVSGGSFTGNLGGNCTGGCRTGTCPGGSSPVICGVSPDVCASVIAQGYACTTAPCGLSACQAVGSAPTPPPTGSPAPTIPPPSNPTPAPGKAQIWVFVDKQLHTVGDLVEIQVCQKPNCCWEKWYYYDPIAVKVGSGPKPYGTVVCEAKGFKSEPHCNSCETLGNKTNSGQDENCTWDTTGWPAGDYSIGVFTGGHSGQGYCNDGAASHSVSVRLVAPTPTPSCNVDFLPPSATIHQEEKTSLWANVSVQNGSVSEIKFSSSNPEIATIKPSADPYYAIVSGIAQGGPVTMTANVYLDPGHVLGCSGDSLITVTHPHAWFQTQGGDVYGHSGISSSIPQTCVDNPGCQEYFSLALNGYSGLISSPGGPTGSTGGRDFGEGMATETAYEDGGSLDGSAQAVIDDYSYKHFSYLADTACKEGQGENNSFNPEVECFYDVTSINQFPLDLRTGKQIFVYNVDENYNSVTITDPDSNWAIGDNKVLVFVNFSHPSLATLTVNSQPAGFFALITNGNMEISQGTTDPTSTTPQLQGVYIADGQIKTEGLTHENEKFIGQGIFYAKGGFDLGRDLEENNKTYPAELFLFDPQYLFTAPRVVRKKPYLWREVVP